MFKLDPEIAATFAAQLASGVERPAPPPPGDPLALRAFTEVSMGPVFGSLPDAPDVTVTPCRTIGADGGTVAMSWYERTGGAKGPAVVYAHGGGMIAGTVAQYDKVCALYVQLTGVPFLSVDYRLAPEFSEQGLGRDVLAGIEWLIAEAARLGVDTGRISVMGDSGGGGIAAAAAIMARDKGVGLASQILIYPMLDDRNIVPDPLLVPTAIWSYEANETAWAAVVGGLPGGAGVSPYHAPARLREFAGLAPAYIEVGELDIFRDESIRYALELVAAGVSCELHVHPGAPHGHDWANLASGISRRSLSDRVRVIAAI